jgi:hypothetical protein
MSVIGMLYGGVADETSSSSALTGVGCECGKRNVKQSGTGWYGL